MNDPLEAPEMLRRGYPHIVPCSTLARWFLALRRFLRGWSTKHRRENMSAITMQETQAQRDAERVREHAPKLLAGCEAAARIFDTGPIRVSHEYAGDLAMIREAIEYATGAHDPGEYPEAGYETDAAGTALG